MKRICLILIKLICIGNCVFAQELLFEDGLYYEKANPSDDSFDKYTRDNISYKQNSTFTFNYYYVDNLGKKKKFIKSEKFSEENPLNLVSYEMTGDSVIDRVTLQVDDKMGMYIPSDMLDSQTRSGYDYLNSKGETEDAFLPFEMAGIIDNPKNVWMHPPRCFTFSMLELNPFPFYYYDESVKHWNWKLEVGGPYYLDYRWIDAKGSIIINYEYIREKDELITIPFGEINCKVVRGTATSEFNGKQMKTRLKSYYHPKYGFVKLDYDNINGSKLIMELIEMKQVPSKPVSKAEVLAVYHQTCCLEYFQEEIALRKDSTFKYTYKNKSYNELHEGKWKLSKDTLILFDYILNPEPFKILNGEETNLPELKDSISIVFKNPKTNELVFNRLTINGKCVKSVIGSTLGYRIPKQFIKNISLRTGIYYVKNEEANSFVIYDESKRRTSKEARVTNISKCIMSDDAIIKVDCDQSLDPAYKLPKK